MSAPACTAGRWDRDTALAQIEKCDFECEGGPLANNVAWRFLKDALVIGPKYLPGQGVWFEVVAEASGVSLSQWVHFYIVGVFMSSTPERRLWTYSLSYDPPAPRHYGTTHFNGIAEAKLRLEKPVADDAAKARGEQS